MKLFSLAEKYFQNPDSTLQISPHNVYSSELSFGFSCSIENGVEIHRITRELVTSLSHIRDGIQNAYVLTDFQKQLIQVPVDNSAGQRGIC